MTSLTLDPAFPPDALRRPPVFPPVCASAWGDDPYGLWIEVAIANVTQRFRWIEPGEFVMGSPDEEKERDGDEGPQHVVRLSEGYWLADSACPQAMWRAVMKDNPSRFADDANNPVENVSWDDVQGFLQKLDEWLPGVTASLPTEAEWEYACRARTTTPFSFGDTITTDVANYNGNQPYSGGAKGEFREKTVAVKSFPPNPWGLYQMHGNVWEWCADGFRTYDASAQIDPRGPERGEDPRALRGGSWNLLAWWLRSACRRRRRRGERNVNAGFRFSLRSTSKEAGAERLAERAAAEPSRG
jgi:formylglycine-generating enzyme required for sulfatase activity